MTAHWIQRALKTLDRPDILRRVGARGRRAAVVTAGITLLAAGAIGASMTALSWNNAGGGTASTAANWSPAQVPTSADDLTFNLNNTYTVTYNSSAPSSRSHTYRDGIVTLSATSPHTVTNGIIVGNLSGDIATATLTTGTVTSGNIVGNGAITVASASGSIGTLNVNDDDADLILTTSTGDLTVAGGGAGLLNVTNGGLVQVADRFTVGSNSTSSSTVTVSGFSIAPIARSTLDVNGTGSAAAIGAGGDVAMTVNTGALADFAGDVNVAQGSASTSTLSVAGVGLVDAEINVGGDLNIGRNQAAGSAGGAGTVNVNADGALDVTGTLNVAGDPDGGTGTLHLANGGAMTAGSFAVGPGGTLDFDGGALDVNGGTFTFTNPAVDFVLGGVDSPVVTLTNVDATLQATATTTALTVGGGAGSNRAGLNIFSGSALTIPAGDIVIGQSSDNAILDLRASDLSMPTTAKLIVGQSGKAWFEAEDGANVTGGDVFVGQNAGSDGFMLTESGGTTLNFQRVYVGGSNLAAGGTGFLWANVGSVFNVSGLGVNLKVWPSGFLEVIGTVNSPGTIQILGDAGVINDGVINAVSFDIQSGGELRGVFGTVAANVLANTGSLITADNGSFTMGNAASTSGFVNNGTLVVNGGLATILDANTANVNTASLVGGTLVVPNGATLANGTTLSGHGTVDADIANFGSIVPADSGLAFKGVVTGVGQGFFGTRVSFIDGGGFTGTGGILAEIAGDATSVITPTGSLTLGEAASTNGIDFDGAINVANRSVSLFDADYSFLGGPVTIGAGGSLTAANGLALKSGGTITGTGTVDASVYGYPGSSIVATGPLIVGTTAVFVAVDLRGALDVGAATVTLRTDDLAGLGGSVTIAGGAILLDSPDPDAFFLFTNGSSLVGYGVLANGSVYGLPGAVITATGTLTMGRSDTGEGFNGNGCEIHVGPHVVNLLDPGVGQLGHLTTIDGGTLTCNKDLELVGGADLDTLRGTGQVAASSVLRSNANSFVQPGNPIGTLTVGQDFVQEVGGELSIQVGGAGALAGDPNGPQESVSKSASVVWDQLIVPGTATIAGTLRVAQLPGLVVATGDSFPILTCAARVGTFGVVVFDDPYLDNAFDVVYTPTAVVLVARATTGVELPPIGDASDGSEDSGVTDGATPASYGLRVSGRNPFSASDGAAFEYDVPRASAPVAISVFDVSGRRIADLVSGAQFAGTHSASWRGGELNALPSGVYFLRMDAAGFGATKRLVLVR